MGHYRRRAADTDYLEDYPTEKVRPSYTRPYEPSSRRPTQGRPGPQPTRTPRGNTRNLQEEYYPEENQRPRMNARSLRGEYYEEEDYQEEPRIVTRRPRQQVTPPVSVPKFKRPFKVSMMAVRSCYARRLPGTDFLAENWQEIHHEAQLFAGVNEDAVYARAEKYIYEIFPEEEGYSKHSINMDEIDEDFINGLINNRKEIAAAMGGI